MKTSAILGDLVGKTPRVSPAILTAMTHRQSFRGRLIQCRARI